MISVRSENLEGHDSVSGLRPEHITKSTARDRVCTAAFNSLQNQFSREQSTAVCQAFECFENVSFAPDWRLVGQIIIIENLS